MKHCGRCGKQLRGGPKVSFDVLGLSERSARDLGVSGSTWQNYMCHGLGREAAERIANRLGKHPYEIWPELLERDAGMRPCDVCEALFLPRRPSVDKYCGSRCRSVAGNRRRREQRGERHRALQAAWRAANADVYRKHHRRYMRQWRERKRREEAA